VAKATPNASEPRRAVAPLHRAPILERPARRARRAEPQAEALAHHGQLRVRAAAAVDDAERFAELADGR